jgi:uncharacterized protein (TIGR03437 family)
VNTANLRPTVAPGSLVAIQGRNLASSSASASPPFPTALGGVCVTLNNRPLPLAATSTGEIRAQIPPDLAAGRYPLVVRNIDRRAANLLPSQVTVARYAPAVVVDPQTKQAAIYHEDGQPVTTARPANRDDRLTIFAIGLGATKPQVAAGRPAPEDAITDPLKVYFGDPRYAQSEMDVEWAGLAPGLVGVYQIRIYVPGFRMRGENLDVTLTIGGISSPTKGEMDPRVTVR